MQYMKFLPYLQVILYSLVNTTSYPVWFKAKRHKMHDSQRHKMHDSPYMIPAHCTGTGTWYQVPPFLVPVPGTIDVSVLCTAMGTYL